MKWLIPAKTFLVGEYAATAGQGAIVLTTPPCFELTLTQTRCLQGIHPDSPAGRLWTKHAKSCGLKFYSPLPLGGLGASSAEFLGVYFALLAQRAATFDRAEVLDLYFQYAFQGKGVRPSGYDLIAQSIGSAYINRQLARYERLSWVFDDLCFILVHTGNKLKTHQHLETLSLSEDAIMALDTIVSLARNAFLSQNSQVLIQAIHQYHEALSALHLVCQSTLDLLSVLRPIPGILAMKGCGALGADVLLLLIAPSHHATVMAQLRAKKLRILSNNELYNI